MLVPVSVWPPLRDGGGVVPAGGDVPVVLQGRRRLLLLELQGLLGHLKHKFVINMLLWLFSLIGRFGAGLRKNPEVMGFIHNQAGLPINMFLFVPLLET